MAAKRQRTASKEVAPPLQSGFGNEFASEALPGALPVGQNNPQKCPYGLYAEQLSGTAFTAPRGKNQRSWLYRIRPSVLHGPFRRISNGRICGDWSGDGGSGGSGETMSGKIVVDPTQMRWSPEPLLAPVPAGAAPASSVAGLSAFSSSSSSSSSANPTPPAAVTFVAGLATMAGAGDPCAKHGLAIHMYNCNASMVHEAFSCADGDLLIVPETGALRLRTEFGVLTVDPCEIAVVPRGVKFAVELPNSEEEEEGGGGAASGQQPSGGTSASCRGYVLELYEGHFELPNLGPIGANGLANPRDFLYPTAAFEDVDYEDSSSSASSSEPSASSSSSSSGGGAKLAGSFTVVHKFGGQLFSAAMDHSPFDVVAWHGNYAPCKYDLRRYCCINSVTFDHPDPSIYTVLTAPSDTPGTAMADFVIFPPRWMVMEHTFRPPWYHRNCMTEFMGMVYGKYDAKEGFMPGGASLHSCMSAHGPDAPTFAKASTMPLAPVKFDAGLAFMFETTLILKLTAYATGAPHRDNAYPTCWRSVPKNFTGEI